MQAVLRALDEAPLERARALVQRALTSWRFHAHVSGQRKGDYPVAVLDPKKAAAIGSKSRILLLSNETAIEKRRKHKLAVEDFRRIQAMLDKGRWFRQKERNAILFAENDGELWRIVIKSTGDGKEAFVKTLHRSQERQLRNALRNPNLTPIQ